MIPERVAAAALVAYGVYLHCDPLDPRVGACVELLDLLEGDPDEEDGWDDEDGDPDESCVDDEPQIQEEGACEAEDLFPTIERSLLMERSWCIQQRGRMIRVNPRRPYDLAYRIRGD